MLDFRPFTDMIYANRSTPHSSESSSVAAKKEL
jgi:hypothetical protein